MEPDEATDALRDLTAEERDEILAAMDPAKSAELTRLLSYPEHEAGGFMTTALLTASLSETIGELAARLPRARTAVPKSSMPSPWSTTDGRLVWDLPLLQLLVNPSDVGLGDLVGEAEPVTVGIHAGVGRGGRSPHRRPAAVHRGGRRGPARWAASWPTT